MKFTDKLLMTDLMTNSF